VKGPAADGGWYCCGGEGKVAETTAERGGSDLG